MNHGCAAQLICTIVFAYAKICVLLISEAFGEMKDTETLDDLLASLK